MVNAHSMRESKMCDQHRSNTDKRLFWIKNGQKEERGANEGQTRYAPLKGDTKSVCIHRQVGTESLLKLLTRRYLASLLE